jgi:MFS family permease
MDKENLSRVMDTGFFSAEERLAPYKRRRLFVTSAVALFLAGVGAALRADVAGEIQRVFLIPLDAATSATKIGSILGLPFLAYAVTIAVGSAALDFLGMKRLLPLCGMFFFLGTGCFLLTPQLSRYLPVFTLLQVAAFISGIGWGLAETVINPLTTTLYPDQKTAQLNILHAWWPAGLIVGGLIGFGMTTMHLGWQWKLSTLLPLSLLEMGMCLGVRFPPTDRVAAGVSTREMVRELRRPLFLVLFCSMFLTAAAELAPGQWVDLALTRTVHMAGILLLVYVSSIMFVVRHFAGTIAHRLSPIGLLWTSCLLASSGLVSLSYAHSPLTGILAATLWGCGVCFLWPTMIAMASERFPRGGPLLMGLMGTAGTLSISFVLPLMGSIFDRRKLQLAGGASNFATLSGSRLEAVLAGASQYSFRAVAILPAVLLVVFGWIWFRDRAAEVNGKSR